MRLAGSYSSILFKRSRSRRCSVPSDNRNFCHRSQSQRGGGGVKQSLPASPRSGSDLPEAWAHLERLALGLHVVSSLGAVVPVQTAPVEVPLLSEGGRSRSLRRSQSLGCSGVEEGGGYLLLWIILRGMGPWTLSIMARCSRLSWVYKEKPGENPGGGGDHHQLPGWRRRTW